eukprot:scaffold105994_cov21-Tisochrysis_lutea.AAC.1
MGSEGVPWVVILSEPGPSTATMPKGRTLQRQGTATEQDSGWVPATRVRISFPRHLLKAVSKRDGILLKLVALLLASSLCNDVQKCAKYAENASTPLKIPNECSVGTVQSHAPSPCRNGVASLLVNYHSLVVKAHPH